MDTVGSTQDLARSSLGGGELPVLVSAAKQLSGRGRTGSTWISAPRAVATSLAMPMPWPLDRLGPLTLVAGSVARDVLAAHGAEVWLEWPNDLVDGSGAKIAGILAETSDEVVVIGIGINLFFPAAPPGMAGVYADDPGDEVRDRIAEAWGVGLLSAVAAGPGWDRARYVAACVTVGSDITWEPDGAGTAIDIAGDGALVVDTENGRTELRSGEVSVVRRATLAAGEAGDGEQGERRP